jgi:hypothetical protein
MSRQGYTRALMRCVLQGNIDATVEQAEHVFALVFASVDLRGKPSEVLG